MKEDSTSEPIKSPADWIRQRVEAWNHHWFDPVSAYPLAAFRILFGIYLFAYFASFCPRLFALFSSHGVVVPYWIPLKPLPPAAVLLVYAAMMTSILAWIVGWKTRWTTPILVLGYSYFYFLNLAVKNTAYDRLNLIFLCILCMGETDRVWAVGAGRGGADAPRIPAWCTRLIQWQICLLYFGAGFWKVLSMSWHSGEMLRWTFIGPWATPLGFWFVRLNPNPWVLDWMTWSVVFFEIGFCWMVHQRGWRPWVCLAGLSFHVAVGLVLNIPEFLNCVTTYVLFFGERELMTMVEPVLRLRRTWEKRRCG